MASIVVRNSAINESDDANVAVLEIEGRISTLVVTQHGRTAEFQFTSQEWAEFIAGTVDIETLLRCMGIRNMLPTAGLVPLTDDRF